MLDLRGTPCPLNFIRTRLALEALAPGSTLQVWLDPGEPDRLVVESLQGSDQVKQLERIPQIDGSVQLKIIRGCIAAGSGDGPRGKFL